MKIIITVFSIALAMLYTGCKKSAPNEHVGTPQVLNCDNVDSRFTARVLPIIQNSCAINGCHSAGSPNGPGALTNYAQIKSASAAIRSSVISGVMPKTGTLNTEEKNSIICWVNNGAPDN